MRKQRKTNRTNFATRPADAPAGASVFLLYAEVLATTANVKFHPADKYGIIEVTYAK